MALARVSLTLAVCVLVTPVAAVTVLDDAGALDRVGRDVTALSREWWSWIASIPAPSSPQNPESAGESCRLAQTGAVFKLASVEPRSPFARAERGCAIETGRYILIPIFATAAVRAADNARCEEVCAKTEARISEIDFVSLVIDGAPIDDAGILRRATKDCFPVRVPEDNIFGVVGRANVEICSDGYWVLLGDIEPGEHSIQFEACFIDGSALSVDYTINVGTPFRRGDTNADERLDLSDAIRALLFLFAGAGDLPCLEAADVNDSGVVDLSDAIFLLSFLFLSGSAPPAPGPNACAPDPPGSPATSCESFEPCPGFREAGDVVDADERSPR